MTMTAEQIKALELIAADAQQLARRYQHASGNEQLLGMALARIAYDIHQVLKFDFDREGHSDEIR